MLYLFKHLNLMMWQDRFFVLMNVRVNSIWGWFIISCQFFVHLYYFSKIYITTFPAKILIRAHEAKKTVIYQ